MNLRTPLRLILLITALVTSGAATKVAHAVPPDICSAWDLGCTQDCWYWYHMDCPLYYNPDYCQQSYTDCMSYCCLY